MSSLTQEHLDGAKCGHPQCDCPGVMLVSRCHPGAGLDVEYKAGALVVTCHHCKDFVESILVAKATS